MPPISPDALIFSGLIFILRVLNYAISTLRLVFITRNRKTYAAVLAFVEAFLFAVVMTRVVTDLENSMINLMAYCVGASVGSFLGMMLETRLIKSYSTVSIITSQETAPLVELVRAEGFGATVTRGEGRDGAVAIIRCSLSNRDLPTLLKLVRENNPEAFIEIEAARALVRGWYPGSNNEVNVVGR